jgi:hypothetical protein
VEIEELLSKADYGPDYSPSVHRRIMPETCEESDGNIIKTSNVLGLDRDAVMAQVYILMFSSKGIVPHLFFNLDFQINETNQTKKRCFS